MTIKNDNPTQIDGSKLSDEQIASASDFLAGRNWHETKPTRKTSRDDIARLLAWYGAIRFQAGAHGIGTLERPGRPIIIAPPPTEESAAEFDITDLDFRSMEASSSHL